MDTNFRKILAVTVAALCLAPSIHGADAPVKREMRSAWVATVWRLDWPSATITSTGNQTQIDRQKQDMTTLLDSLHLNNMNAINFQVRDRCDAFYKSSYEPWSSDLVDERGKDPGWDPLEWVVEECHKRGMECHAWINPYRYESVVGQWDGCAKGNYRADHPDWLLDVNGASILNPGKPEVTQRICDIIKEIVDNYDVDGVLFDDYFYLSGTASSQDADLYNAYVAQGGTLDQSDWRRDNVNCMIASVYRTIKESKPWVRFGVSPAGIACTNISVARRYGIPACPTGSDWQYNDIYSDPIAWISQKSLDFISPQIYWTIGHSTDYDAASKWWSETAGHFGRHFYSSHSISSLTASSKIPEMSTTELVIWDQDKMEPKASGPNNATYGEYADEIRLNREYTVNDAPGSIFYSAKYLYKTSPLFSHYLKTTVFNTPALVPAITWYPGYNPGIVSNIKRDGRGLSWDGYDNVRYTIYAVPASIAMENFANEPEYLLGTSYVPSYLLPDNRLDGYNYAVCVLDRYGNEYSPVFLGAATGTLASPGIISPKGGEQIETPFDFKWEPVAGASDYIIEIGTDAAMTDLSCTRSVSSTTCSSNEFDNIPLGIPLYWRVRACGINNADGVSSAERFIATNLVITSPADKSTGVTLTPSVTWSIPDRAVELQISTSAGFEDSEMILDVECSTGSYTVPDCLLGAYTTYYARLLYTRNGEDCVSPVTSFTTLKMTPSVPSIAWPIAGGDLHSDEYIRINPTEGVRSLRIEVSASESFPSRSSYISENATTATWTDSKSGAEIRISNKNLVDGAIYYARVRASYNSENGLAKTEYSDAVDFHYRSESGGIEDVDADNGNGILKIDYSDPSCPCAVVALNGHATVKVIDIAGKEVSVLHDGSVNGRISCPMDLPSGIYIVTVDGQYVRERVKVIINNP